MDDDRRDPDTQQADDWEGGRFRPWLNPPGRKGGSGATQGGWRYAIGVITALVVISLVLLVLVQQGTLDRGWNYVALPVAGFGAALAFVLTILKARSSTR